ncbi:hypothetical protein ACHAXA_011294 [Cyclostephanos tholiformis]|uniref:Uncharacterized protein n=1 Tax=Cyclostephanos tholiformis TaxID=382380 RepID=A0ABD3RFX6_9STRA
MNRWITQSAVFGAIISKATGNPWKLSAAKMGPVDGFNPMFEFMNKCSGANMDTDSCLVSRTLNALKPPPSNQGAFPSSTLSSPITFDSTTAPPSRLLQQECPGAPDITEEAFRFMMGDSRAQCDQLGVSISDQDFESVVNGFMTIFGSESCFQQLCDGPNVMVIEIMFNEMAECAQVQPDMPECLKNELFEMMLNGFEDGQRKLQSSSGCQRQSKSEIMFQVSNFLEGAEAMCFELGEPVSQTQLEKANTDLVSIFAATHCIGGCEEDTNDDGDHNDDDDCMQSGINSVNIAIKFISQCANLDLNTDTCLALHTINALIAGSLPSDHYNRHRFLQTSSNEGGCIPPELDESMLRPIVEGSMQQCQSTEQEVDDTVSTFMLLFGAQSCWVDLCAEQANPSEVLVGIMLQEMGQCAGAKLDVINQCLLDQIFALISSPESHDLRRSLQLIPGESDGSANPWAEEPNEDHVRFYISMMLTGAQEKCIDMGVTFAEGEVAAAEAELIKLFEAKHCWGTPSTCNSNSDIDCFDDDDSAYLGFYKHSATWMLGQCVDIDELSCVFSRSIDVIHNMKLFGWSHDGQPDPNYHQIEPDFSRICVPPTLLDDDIDLIAAHAQAYCMNITDGIVLDDSHYNQTVEYLKNLVAGGDCWEILCQDEMRAAIAEEWMNTCASTDLKFLTAQGQFMLNDEGFSLDIDRLRCMADFIAFEMWEPNASLTCSLAHLGSEICGLDSGRAAYIHCGGEITPPMPPSMSFSMSYSFERPDEGFSMQYNDWFVIDDQIMIMYVEEVCSIVANLQSATSICCLKPICNGVSIDDALTFDYDNDRDVQTLYPTGADNFSPSPSINRDVQTLYPTGADNSSPSPSIIVNDSTLAPIPATQTPATPTPATTDYVSQLPTAVNDSTLAPTLSKAIITSPPTIKATPTSSPVKMTSRPTQKPTQIPISKSTSYPTTGKPVDVSTSSFGEIEVSFQCGAKLEGIEISEIDVKNLDDVVYLLASVLSNFLPKGALVRILSVGGISVVRRLLRSLEEDESVDIQFEIILKQVCDTAECGNSADLAGTLYKDVTSNFKAKVQSGELTTSIQEAAIASGVPALAKASMSASSLQLDAATVTVTKAPETPVKPNSAPTRFGTVGTALALAWAVAMCLFSWP